MKQKTDLKETVIYSVYTQSGDHGGYDIRVVSWSTNGKQTPPVLEKRYFGISNGNKYWRKSSGFSKKDLNVIVDHWDKITEAMGG